MVREVAELLLDGRGEALGQVFDLPAIEIGVSVWGCGDVGEELVEIGLHFFFEILVEYGAKKRGVF
jgi:hypothetical protein